MHLKKSYGTHLFFVILFIMLFPMTATSKVVFNATVTINPLMTINLYVDSFDNSRTGWNKHGLSPYLNSQNQPTDYVELPSGQELIQQVGDFGFTNSEKSSETINSVYLYVYGRKEKEQDSFSVYLWDGSTWGSPYNITSSDWAWTSWDVSSRLDTWVKIDSVKIYLMGANDQEKGQIGADAAYLYVDFY